MLIKVRHAECQLYLFPPKGMILKRDDFDFDIVNFPFFDGDVPRHPSYMYEVYISQLITFGWGRES